MSPEYQRVRVDGQGLRLHLNENTAGCSPAVLAALHRLTREDAAFYPDYDAVTDECAAFFGMDPEEVLLTNGLDEGILAAAVATLSRSDGAALIIEPAFDMYAAAVEAVRGRIVTVAPRPGFAFPTREVLDRIDDTIRLIFLTHPNNPTGQRIPRQALDAITAAATRALVFVDEAYVEFSGDSLLPDVHRFPNLVIGRTFAKAYGLAALRVGAVIGPRMLLEPLRRVVLPYSMNVAALVGLRAALDDREYVKWYISEVEMSRRLLYAACDRLGLRYWPSAANFVLVHAGARAAELTRGLAGRGVFVRDRSTQPGCAGCVRITAGVVAHTEACIAAMEAVWRGEA